MRPLLALLGVAAACASGDAGHRPAPIDAALYDRHLDAVSAFQRALDHAHGDPLWRCAELCNAAEGACQTATALCTHTQTHAGPPPAEADPRCQQARNGCSWTLTLLPRGCRYCAAEPPPAADSVPELSP